jgi:hypothetical protein
MSNLTTIGNISSHGTRRGDRWTKEEDDLLLREIAKGTRNNLIVALYFNTRSTEGIRKRKKKLEQKYPSRLDRLRSVHGLEVESSEAVSQMQLNLSREKGRIPQLATMEDEKGSEWSEFGGDDDVLMHSEVPPRGDFHGQPSSSELATDSVVDEQAPSAYSEPMRTVSETREEASTFEQNGGFAIRQASAKAPEDTACYGKHEIGFDEQLLQSSPFIADSSPRSLALNHCPSLKSPEDTLDAYSHSIDNSSTSYRKGLEIYQNNLHANNAIDDEVDDVLDLLVHAQGSVGSISEELGICDAMGESTYAEYDSNSVHNDDGEESDSANESDGSSKTFNSDGSGYFGYLAEQQLLSDAIQVNEGNREESTSGKMSGDIEEMAGESDKGGTFCEESPKVVQQDKAICLTANRLGNSLKPDPLSYSSVRWLVRTPEAKPMLNSIISDEEGIGDFPGDTNESDQSDDECSVVDDRASTIKKAITLSEQTKEVREQSEESINDFEDAKESLDFHDSVQGTMSQAKNMIRDLFSWSHRSRRAE